MASYAIPLVVIPWLTRTLLPEQFGHYSFALAVSAYVTLLTDYGFNLSATQQLSTSRKDRNAQAQIYWATLCSKLLLCGVSFIVVMVSTHGIHTLAIRAR
jgi:O-antigen/teichoic acid export membrane protein